MPQVLLDEDAKRLLDIEKQRLRENGRPGASLSDAVRSLDQLKKSNTGAWRLDQLKKSNTGAWRGHNGPVIDDDHPRRPRGNAGGA